MSFDRLKDYHKTAIICLLQPMHTDSSCDTRSTWLSEVRSKRRSSSPQQASVKHPVPEDVEDTAGVNWLALLEKCSNSQCESDSD